jgi:hypothetical protein
MPSRQSAPSSGTPSTPRASNRPVRTGGQAPGPPGALPTEAGRGRPGGLADRLKIK